MINKKLIILDYRNGRVVIIPSVRNLDPLAITEDHELQVWKWAKKNQTTLRDCNWMVWDGEVRYEE